MEFINTTPYISMILPGRINFPGHSRTVIVKGTFDMAHGHKAIGSKTQVYPTGDIHYPDDIEMEGSLRYESDFAFYKPKADLLLAGHCHAPDKTPVQGLEVRFRVGSHSKKLHILGDRQWEAAAGGYTITDPVPFVQKELRYENSFGGDGFKANPTGRGYRKKKAGTAPWFLPCIQAPDTIIESVEDCPLPAGFGPLGKFWQDRRSKLGTYDNHWEAERWPWYPEDFDWAFFNGAPPDMQVDGFLTGDETLAFTHLHPLFARYEARLPGTRVRCFIQQSAEQNFSLEYFREIPMNLDTLWVDMDAEQIVLVWRGRIEGGSDDALEEDRFFIMEESLKDEKHPLGHCHELFRITWLKEQTQWEVEPKADTEPETETANAPTEPDHSEENEAPATPEPDKTILKKQLRAGSAALMAKLGIDLDKLDPKDKKKVTKEQDRLIDEMIEDDPVKSGAAEQAKTTARMNQALSQLGIDPKKIPKLSPKAMAEQTRMFSELSGGKITTIPESLHGPLQILGALFPVMGIDPENLDSFIKEAGKYMPPGPDVPSQPGTQKTSQKEKTGKPIDPAPPLTREKVAQNALGNASFAGQNLNGLDLSGLDLRDLDFTGAELKGTILKSALLEQAIFKNADLKGTNLQGADARRTDFTGANLKNADFKDAGISNARFTDAVLKGAILTDADAEQANFQNADLENTLAKDTYFSGANLAGAKLTHSDMSGADFSQAVLDGTNCNGATLFETSLEGASCKRASFIQADLTLIRASEGADFSNTNFTRAFGTGTMWMDSILNGANFSYSHLEKGDFTGATLKDADLTAADMKFSRFTRADLSHARLAHFNGFKAGFDQAILDNTDMQSANVYGAAFLDARIRHLNVSEAIITMTALTRDAKE